MSSASTQPPDTSTLCAPVWRRLAALLYDLFILLALSFAYGAVTTAINVAVSGTGDGQFQPMFHGPVFLAGWLAVLAAFYGGFWHRGGQTIGMRAWRIRLVGMDGRAPDWRAIGLRLLVAPPCVAAVGLGYWAAWCNPQRRCLQDMLSATNVTFAPKQK